MFTRLITCILLSFFVAACGQPSKEQQILAAAQLFELECLKAGNTDEQCSCGETIFARSVAKHEATLANIHRYVEQNIGSMSFKGLMPELPLTWRPMVGGAMFDALRSCNADNLIEKPY